MRRISGGWRLAGAALSLQQTFYLRSQGRTTHVQSSGSGNGLVQSTWEYHLTGNEGIFTDGLEGGRRRALTWSEPEWHAMFASPFDDAARQAAGATEGRSTSGRFRRTRTRRSMRTHRKAPEGLAGRHVRPAWPQNRRAYRAASAIISNERKRSVGSNTSDTTMSSSAPVRSTNCRMPLRTVSALPTMLQASMREAWAFSCGVQ